jgi:hypothetical protein
VQRDPEQAIEPRQPGTPGALTAQTYQLMAEGDDSKEPSQMTAKDLQTFHISVKARLDVTKLNLMLSADCSHIGTGSSNPLRSANESLRTNAVVALFRGLG